MVYVEVRVRRLRRVNAVTTAAGDRSELFPAIERKHGQPVQFWFDVLSRLGAAKYPEQVAHLRQQHGFSQAHANAVVLWHRGSTSARRFETPEEYLATLDQVRATTIRAIFAAITDRFPELELVVAWNQPMLRQGNQYVFGVSAAARHLTLGPWGNDPIARFADRLTGYEVNKKTIKIPIDWTVDADLVCDLVATRLAEIDAPA